ncbi:MAG: hypothetical protein WCK02_06215 [Bacteroidota bacterium]
MKKSLLLILIIIFNIEFLYSQNDSVYDDLVKVEVNIRNPYSIGCISFRPYSFKDDKPYYKLIVSDYSPYMRELIDSLYFKTKKLKSGEIIKNQMSNGAILIEFYFSEKGKNERIEYIFIDLYGHYMINNSEVDYIKEEQMITFIKNNFPITKNNFFIESVGNQRKSPIPLKK